MGSRIRRGLAGLARKAKTDAVAFVEALRADVFGATPELSIRQVGDAIGESADSLYKQIEGQRKFNPGKLGILAALTGNTAAIETLARQCGGFFVAEPEVEGEAAFHELAEEILAQATVVKDAARIYQDGEVDRREAREDVPRLDHEIDALVAAVLRLRARVDADAETALHRPKLQAM